MFVRMTASDSLCKKAWSGQGMFVYLHINEAGSHINNINKTK